ncbi:MAG: hypothetical protein JXB88_01615 [Spirochaetales bacterium]|nr:hypothetical protein [Spirochaetales bacterium]
MMIDEFKKHIKKTEKKSKLKYKSPFGGFEGEHKFHISGIFSILLLFLPLLFLILVYFPAKSAGIYSEDTVSEYDKNELSVSDNSQYALMDDNVFTFNKTGELITWNVPSNTCWKNDFTCSSFGEGIDWAIPPKLERNRGDIFLAEIYNPGQTVFSQKQNNDIIVKRESPDNLSRLKKMYCFSGAGSLRTFLGLTGKEAVNMILDTRPVKGSLLKDWSDIRDIVFVPRSNRVYLFHKSSPYIFYYKVDKHQWETIQLEGLPGQIDVFNNGNHDILTWVDEHDSLFSEPLPLSENVQFPAGLPLKMNPLGNGTFFPSPEGTYILNNKPDGVEIGIIKKNDFKNNKDDYQINRTNTYKEYIPPVKNNPLSAIIMVILFTFIFVLRNIAGYTGRNKETRRISVSFFSLFFFIISLYFLSAEIFRTSVFTFPARYLSVCYSLTGPGNIFIIFILLLSAGILFILFIITNLKYNKYLSMDSDEEYLENYKDSIEDGKVKNKYQGKKRSKGDRFRTRSLQLISLSGLSILFPFLSHINFFRHLKCEVASYSIPSPFALGLYFFLLFLILPNYFMQNRYSRGKTINLLISLWFVCCFWFLPSGLIGWKPVLDIDKPGTENTIYRTIKKPGSEESHFTAINDVVIDPENDDHWIAFDNGYISNYNYLNRKWKWFKFYLGTPVHELSFIKGVKKNILIGGNNKNTLSYFSSEPGSKNGKADLTLIKSIYCDHYNINNEYIGIVSEPADRSFIQINKIKFDNDKDCEQEVQKAFSIGEIYGNSQQNGNEQFIFSHGTKEKTVYAINNALVFRDNESANYIIQMVKEPIVFGKYIEGSDNYYVIGTDKQLYIAGELRIISVVSDKIKTTTVHKILSANSENKGCTLLCRDPAGIGKINIPDYNDLKTIEVSRIPIGFNHEGPLLSGICQASKLEDDNIIVRTKDGEIWFYNIHSHVWNKVSSLSFKYISCDGESFTGLTHDNAVYSFSRVFDKFTSDFIDTMKKEYGPVLQTSNDLENGYDYDKNSKEYTIKNKDDKKVRIPALSFLNSVNYQYQWNPGIYIESNPPGTGPKNISHLTSVVRNDNFMWMTDKDNIYAYELGSFKWYPGGLKHEGKEYKSELVQIPWNSKSIFSWNKKLNTISKYALAEGNVTFESPGIKCTEKPFPHNSGVVLPTPNENWVLLNESGQTKIKVSRSLLNNIKERKERIAKSFVRYSDENGSDGKEDIIIGSEGSLFLWNREYKYLKEFPPDENSFLNLKWNESFDIFMNNADLFWLVCDHSCIQPVLLKDDGFHASLPLELEKNVSILGVIDDYLVTREDYEDYYTINKKIKMDSSIQTIELMRIRKIQFRNDFKTFDSVSRFYIIDKDKIHYLDKNTFEWDEMQIGNSKDISKVAFHQDDFPLIAAKNELFTFSSDGTKKDFNDKRITGFKLYEGEIVGFQGGKVLAYDFSKQDWEDKFKGGLRRPVILIVLLAIAGWNFIGIIIAILLLLFYSFIIYNESKEEQESGQLLKVERKSGHFYKAMRKFHEDHNQTIRKIRNSVIFYICLGVLFFFIIFIVYNIYNPYNIGNKRDGIEIITTEKKRDAGSAGVHFSLTNNICNIAYKHNKDIYTFTSSFSPQNGFQFHQDIKKIKPGNKKEIVYESGNQKFQLLSPSYPPIAIYYDKLEEVKPYTALEDILSLAKGLYKDLDETSFEKLFSHHTAIRGISIGSKLFYFNEKGLFLQDQDNNIKRIYDNTIKDLFMKKDENGIEYGLALLTDNSYIRIETSGELSKIDKNNDISHIADIISTDIIDKERNGWLWKYDHSNHLYSVTDSAGNELTFSEQGGFNYNHLREIQKTNDGSLLGIGEDNRKYRIISGKAQDTVVIEPGKIFKRFDLNSDAIVSSFWTWKVNQSPESSNEDAITISFTNADTYKEFALNDLTTGVFPFDAVYDLDIFNDGMYAATDFGIIRYPYENKNIHYSLNENVSIQNNFFPVNEGKKYIRFIKTTADDALYVSRFREGQDNADVFKNDSSGWIKTDSPLVYYLPGTWNTMKPYIQTDPRLDMDIYSFFLSHDPRPIIVPVRNFKPAFECAEKLFFNNSLMHIQSPLGVATYRKKQFSETYNMSWIDFRLITDYEKEFFGEKIVHDGNHFEKKAVLYNPETKTGEFLLFEGDRAEWKSANLDSRAYYLLAEKNPNYINDDSDGKLVWMKDINTNEIAPYIKVNGIDTQDINSIGNNLPAYIPIDAETMKESKTSHGYVKEAVNQRGFSFDNPEAGFYTKENIFLLHNSPAAYSSGRKKYIIELMHHNSLGNRKRFSSFYICDPYFNIIPAGNADRPEVSLLGNEYRKLIFEKENEEALILSIEKDTKQVNVLEDNNFWTWGKKYTYNPDQLSSFPKEIPVMDKAGNIRRVFKTDVTTGEGDFFDNIYVSARIDYIDNNLLKLVILTSEGWIKEMTCHHKQAEYKNYKFSGEKPTLKVTNSLDTINSTDEVTIQSKDGEKVLIYKKKFKRE